MKKNNLIITAGIAITAFTACNRLANQQSSPDVAKLDRYVDSVNKLTPVYTTRNWSVLDNGYQERASEADKALPSLKAADKEKVAASKIKYAILKANYEVKIKEQEQSAKMKDEQAESANSMKTSPDYRIGLRNRLFGEGKIGSDVKFDFVTAGNVLSVYKNFVNTVSDNRDTYSREDWDEIKVLYEALDNRKNAVEKDLAGTDNLKIAALKIKFVAIKATNRGEAKAAENEKSKH
jgi:hypothetical protein